MLFMDNLTINDQGHLVIGQRDTVELAQTFGTPLYLMDEIEIRNNCREYKNSIDKYYGGRGMVAYASKAFCCKAMCAIVFEEGLGLDVVSGSELYTAISAGFPPDKILFHGSNKSMPELAYAVEVGVGRIVVDNFFELELLNQIAKAANAKVNIHFRIKPGIDANTHAYIRTGQIDSKFGFALETNEAMAAVKKALSLENIVVVGIACHIGSQIFEVDSFETTAEVMLGFIAEVKKETGYEIKELDLGGGFGIAYIPEDNPSPKSLYMDKVSVVVKEVCERLDIAMPFIIIEPGRSIVGSPGITLYTVGPIKEIPNIRTYLSVDGGMTDNPRYALYKAKYDMVVANKADRAKDHKYTVVGRCCESGDTLGEDILIQQAKEGDILAVMATGAYNYSMSSNYNRLPKPAVVMVSGQDARVVVRRETYQDIVRNDV